MTAADLATLGPTGFQDAAAALLTAAFGVGIEVMGSGTDGGRDLYVDGPLTWVDDPTGSDGGQQWNGYTVFQIKHKETISSDHQANASWFWGEIRRELDRWADPDKKRDPLPDQLVFVTNVPLTAVPRTGGHDQIRANIDRYIGVLRDSSRDLEDDGTARRARLARIQTIRHIRFWDGGKVGRLLDRYDGVRRAFPGFLTAGDVLADLSQISNYAPPGQLQTVLQADARTSLMGGEGRIYFDEAADVNGRGVPIHDVAIDLPVTITDNDERVHQHQALDYILSRGEHVLRPDLSTVDKPRHIVLVGAPGNGKTTVSKLVVQAYRAALLKDADDLSDQHHAAIAGMTTALQRLGRDGLPRNRRWAQRVDLARHAQEFATDDRSLLRYVAHLISERSDRGDVQPNWLRSWMTVWPCLLVLDGLDEVTEPAVRRRVLDRVRQLVNDAEGDNCDLLVVLTTRPTGYNEDLDPTLFERVDLGPLPVDKALEYGELTTTVRLNHDTERIQTVTNRLRQAAENESMRNLLQTPLQVLIMSIIFESSGQFARDRYTLFWGYYDVVLRRERSKEHLGLRRILQDHGQQIQQLHERVGFELQLLNENGAQSAATLSPAELRQLTWIVLNDAEFDPSGSDAGLLDGILQAATHRLVLLSPQPGTGYGFDVRSLQELMAAKYLIGHEPSTIRALLTTAAVSPHWRNTWIFAAGALYATPLPHQHELAVTIVEQLDSNDPRRLASLVPIAPRLALSLIDDGMVHSLPRWRNRLIKVALRALREPVGSDFVPIARAILRFADTGDDQRRQVVDAARAALDDSPIGRATVHRLQRLTHELCDELGTRPETRGLASVKPTPGRAPSEPSDTWNEFLDELLTQPTTTAIDQEVLAFVGETLQRLAVGLPGSDDSDLELLRELMSTPDIAAAIEAALLPLAPHEPRLILRLRDSLLPPVYGNPIGNRLRSIIEAGA